MENKFKALKPEPVWQDFPKYLNMAKMDSWKNAPTVPYFMSAIGLISIFVNGQNWTNHPDMWSQCPEDQKRYYQQVGSWLARCRKRSSLRATRVYNKNHKSKIIETVFRNKVMNVFLKLPLFYFIFIKRWWMCMLDSVTR